MGKAIGVEFNVQVVSTDKLNELTVRKVDGKPAPDFDTFIWGWGGDPYDPSFLLSLLTDRRDRRLSDSFYSNPEYDRLFEEQAGSFDVEERKAIIQQMVAITQHDLPYLVLTYDPNLQAYRTDRIANVEPVCPADRRRPDLRPDHLRAAAAARAGRGQHLERATATPVAGAARSSRRSSSARRRLRGWARAAGARGYEPRSRSEVEE